MNPNDVRAGKELTVRRDLMPSRPYHHRVNNTRTTIGVNDKMIQLRGRKVEIANTDEDSKWEIVDDPWNWTSDMFEETRAYPFDRETIFPDLKPGQKVILRSDLVINEEYGHFARENYGIHLNRNMATLRGHTMTVEYVNEESISVEENGFLWTTDMFETVRPEQQYLNGEITYEQMKEAKNEKT